MFLPNFKIEDFFCNCNICDPQKISLKGVVMLQALRDHIKRPIGVNSAYRCPSQNQKVGGKPNSSHLTAEGFDVYSVGMSGYDLARGAWAIGFRAIGISDNWCHIGVNKPSGDYDFWTYPPIDLTTTRVKFLRDVGYTGVGGQ